MYFGALLYCLLGVFLWPKVCFISIKTLTKKDTKVEKLVLFLPMLPFSIFVLFKTSLKINIQKLVQTETAVKVCLLVCFSNQSQSNRREDMDGRRLFNKYQIILIPIRVAGWFRWLHVRLAPGKSGFDSWEKH